MPYTEKPRILPGAVVYAPLNLVRDRVTAAALAVAVGQASSPEVPRDHMRPTTAAVDSVRGMLDAIVGPGVSVGSSPQTPFRECCESKAQPVVSVADLKNAPSFAKTNLFKTLLSFALGHRDRWHQVLDALEALQAEGDDFLMLSLTHYTWADEDKADFIHEILIRGLYPSKRPYLNAVRNSLNPRCVLCS